MMGMCRLTTLMRLSMLFKSVCFRGWEREEGRGMRGKCNEKEWMDGYKELGTTTYLPTYVHTHKNETEH